MSNLVTLCRRCHEAKHGERSHSPTIRFTSTGDMPENDFIWYRHFWNEIFPSLVATAVGVRIEPKFDISDAPYRAWHLPRGDIVRIDESLAKNDENDHAPMSVHHYM